MNTATLNRIRQTSQVTESESKRIAEDLQKVSTYIRHFSDVEPYDYQEEFLDDLSTRFRIYRKARQIGFSRMIGWKGLVLALAVPKYERIFISLSLDDAKEKIAHARDLYEAINRKARVPALDVDRKMELSFSNGSRIVCMFSPRGQSDADIDIDEFAFSSEPRAIYDAAIPILIKGGYLSIGSSVLHSGTFFNAIYDQEGGKYTRFTRCSIMWWDCPLHCNDVERARIEAPEMETEERVEKYGTDTLQELFDIMLLEDFQMEFECKPLDDDAALLSWELITATTPTGAGAFRKYENIKELKEKTKGLRVGAGYDIGRRVDAGELSVLVEEHGCFIERFNQSFKKTEFDIQEAALHEFMSVPRAQLRIDSTGMGEPIAEHMENRYPTRAKGIYFTAQSKASLATKIKYHMSATRSALESIKEREDVETLDLKPVIESGIWKSHTKTQMIAFLYSRDDNVQMHSVRKKVSEAGNVIYVVGTKKQQGSGAHEHHADRFWSRALGLESLTDDSLGRARFRSIG